MMSLYMPRMMSLKTLPIDGPSKLKIAMTQMGQHAAQSQDDQ